MRSLGCLVLLGGLAACSRPPAPAAVESPPPAATLPADAPASRPLAVFVTRDHRVEVFAGARFTVFTRGGAPLARALDAAAFDRAYPELRGVLRRGLAAAEDAARGRATGPAPIMADIDATKP